MEIDAKTVALHGVDDNLDTALAEVFGEEIDDEE